MKKSIVRFCYSCNSSETYEDNNGGKHWYSNIPIGWLCENCNNKYFKNPQRDLATFLSYNSRIITFRNKSIFVKKSPRIGVCNWCRAVVGEVNAQTSKKCKKTAMHHES